MLPLYILGNLHCFGMCGPLVMLIGKHPYRLLYFLGRLLSFTLVGTIAGELGEVLGVVLKAYNISAATSFIFGGAIFLLGFYSIMGWQFPGYKLFGNRVKGVERLLSSLIMGQRPWSTFLFGFFTVALPCGQTMIVFSACALSASALSGMINGFLFALLTSPSLFLAMHAHLFLKRLKNYYNLLTGVCAMVVGLMALCRGFAEVEVIPHLVLSEKWHVVLY